MQVGTAVPNVSRFGRRWRYTRANTQLSYAAGQARNVSDAVIESLMFPSSLPAHQVIMATPKWTSCTT